MPDIDQIWTEFGAALRRFVRSRVSCDADRDDIVQEVLLRLHRNASHLDDVQDVAAWLYRIALNAIADHYRAGRHGALHDPLPDELPQPEAAQDGTPAAMGDCLRALLGGVDQKYALAVRLVDVDGVSQAELAKRLDMTPSGAKSRVQRGRAMLRDALLRCCRVELDRRGGIIEFARRSTSDDGRC